MKKTYSEQLKDPRWQRKRLEILQRDEFTCRDCEDKESTLHVHHCLYIRGKEPWEYDDSELRTLFESCHKLREDIERDVRLEFNRLMAMMTREQISDLIPQILEAKEGDVINGVSIMTNTAFDMESDIRWYCEAWTEPTMRPHYEAVTGAKPDWSKAAVQ